MKLSVKKFSKKSLSLLIALIMVISAMPFSPLSSPIEADAAETKTTILVWDASRATANTANGARYSYKDSQSKKTISGIQWGSQTHNSTYLTVSNTALSFAEINNSGEITGNDNIEDLGIRGNKWSFSAKFAYTGSATKTTVFGLSSTTKRNYTQKNTGGSPEISNGYVADLVDIRADGTVYINDNWTSTVSGIIPADLVAKSATVPKTLTVTYDNGNLTIDINGTQKISQPVNPDLFSAGVGNYLAGPNVQVFAGADSGIYPHYKVTNNGDYLYNMNLYSLSGATYVQEGSQPTAPPSANATTVKTALDNDTYKTTYSDYTNSSLTNTTGYMQGIIKATSWQNVDTQFTFEGSNTDTIRMHTLGNAVGVYTGAGSVVFPIVLEHTKTANTSNIHRNIGFDHVSLNNGGNFAFGNTTWKRCNSYTNWGDNSDNTHDFYSLPNGNVDRAESSGNGRFGVDEQKLWKNKITYSGTISDLTYYDKLSSATLNLQADYTIEWRNDWFDSWKWANASNFKTNINTNSSMYVINFAPLKKIMTSDEFESNFYNIYNNRWKYNETARENYFSVMADIVNYDLASKTMTNEDQVRAVALEIKDLVTRYNSYKTPELKYTVTFYDIANGPKGTLKVAPGTTINESQLPALTTPKYNQNNQHYIYYWKNSDNTEFTVPYTVNDNVDISESRKIENCSFEVKSISGNTSTVSCSVCNGGTYTLDIEGYNNIVSVAREAINDTVKYDSASRANLQTVLNDNNTVNDCITIEQVNAKISAIQTAINELDLNQYSITFDVVNEYGNSTETVINAQSYDYGTLLNLQLPDTYQENAVSAWKRSIRGVDSVVGATSHSLQVMITGTTTYTAFVKKATTASEGQAVITLNNKSNKVYDIGYVENNKVVDVNVDVKNGTITIGGQKLTAPTYSFYKVKGFKINGKTVNTGTINITGDIVIKPEYEAISSFTITGGKGVVEKSTTTSWDQRVRLTAETPAQSGKINKWTSTINGQTVVWGYGDSLSFQATQSCTVRCELISKDMATPSVSVDYVSYNLYKANTITAVSRIAVPEGYTVVEYGTILKTSNNLNSTTPSLSAVESATYKKTNAGGVFKATQQITGTNQFAMNFFAATDYEKMYVGAVAYLVYKEANSDEEHVIYSTDNGGKVVTSSYNKTAVGNN